MGTVAEYFTSEPPAGDQAKEIVEQNQLDYLTSQETESFPPLEIDPYPLQIYQEALQETRIQAMLAVLREHDPKSADHVMRTGLYGTYLAYRDGQDDQSLRALAEAGLLHDLGKVAVDPRILRSGSPELAPDDRQAINHHPRVGFDESQPLFKDQLVPELVLTHHCHIHHPYVDNQPGSPVTEFDPQTEHLGQMLAAADIYDALFSDRTYNQNLSRQQRETIMRQTFTGDSKYIDWLLELHDKQHPEQHDLAA